MNANRIMLAGGIIREVLYDVKIYLCPYPITRINIHVITLHENSFHFHQDVIECKLFLLY